MENIKIYQGAKTINSIFGDNVVVGEDTYVEDSTLGNLVQLNRRNMIINSKIGDYTYTGANTVIKKANIGKFCSISWNVSITGNVHDYKLATPHPFTHLHTFKLVDENSPLESKSVCVYNDVWLGMNSCVLPGIKIDSGSIVGAGSVVTKDVPPYTIVAGNPAKIIKYRFSDEIIGDLLEVEWWNWPYEIIKKNMYLFQTNVDTDIINELLHISKSLRRKKKWK